MKQKAANSTIAFLAGVMAVVMLLMLIDEAGATYNKGDDVDVDQNQGQEQDQEQDQNQDQGQSQAQDQANNQSIAFTSPDDITVKRTVGAYAPSIDPSHPCALTWSGGVGGTGFSISGGKAFVDNECNARETSRLFYEFGEREKAIMILCEQPSAYNLAGCKPYQDYNREMKLLDAGHGKLVDENAELRERIEFLLSERLEDQEQCKESVDRVGDELESCLKK